MEKKQVHVVVREKKEELENQIAKQKRNRKILLAIIGPLVLYNLVVATEFSCFAIGLGIFGFVIWKFIGMAGAGKDEYFTNLILNLQHDIKLNSKVRYFLDEVPYSHSSKKTWEGRSRHGNYKYKSTDYWLSCDFICTDNSKVKLDFITKYKVRKGSVIRQKFILKMVVCPNSEFYALDEQQSVASIRNILETQMNEHFDKPIRIRIDSTTSGSQVAFRIKLLQQDEQYTVDQVVGLLRPIFGYFSHYTRAVG